MSGTVRDKEHLFGKMGDAYAFLKDCLAERRRMGGTTRELDYQEECARAVIAMGQQILDEIREQEIQEFYRVRVHGLGKS